ncbi:MAG: hypothetical protein IPN04_07110 [Rhodoferax sp.]|nr:hypothetical protein [Rhodoferax sp.]
MSSGIASLFYGAPIVNRFYFASMLFVLPSLLAYLILNKSNKFNKPIYLLMLVAGLMVITAAYSRYINDSGTYFQNIHSIRNSLKPEKVGIDVPASRYSSALKLQIEDAKMKFKEEDIMFCANHDKSHIIQYVYRQKNILFDRFIPHEVADCATNPKAVGKRIVYHKKLIHFLWVLMVLLSLRALFGLTKIPATFKLDNGQCQLFSPTRRCTFAPNKSGQKYID